jgi:hypothetical protein
MAHVSDVPLPGVAALNVKLGRAFTSRTVMPASSVRTSTRREPILRRRWRRTKKKVANTADTASREMNDTAMTDHAVFSKVDEM